MTKPKITVVVLAAGLGTRMKSQTPKVLHRIAGRPMIAHLMAGLETLNPERLVVVVSDDSRQQVANALAPHQCVVQQSQLGTGDAVKSAGQIIGGFDGDVLVVYGDTPLVSPETLEKMLDTRRAAPKPAVVVLGFRPADPGTYGRLITTGTSSLEAIVEAGDASEDQLALDLCNSGVMAIDGKCLSGLLDRLDSDNANGEYYLTDIVALARADGRECAYVEAAADELVGINSRSDLAAVEAMAQDRLRASAMAGGATLIAPESVHFSFDTKIGSDVTIAPHVFFGPGVSIADNVEIRSFSHIEGATIASGAIIGPFARLRPGADIGENAHIGNFVEIKNTTVEPGAKANHLSYIGDARIGARANIGAGTITCNYDGFNKHHTDIGADVFVGSNVSLVAPVKLGDGSAIGAGSVVTRDIAPDALALERTDMKEIEGAARRIRENKQSEKKG